MEKPFDLKDLEAKLAPAVLPVLISWLEESLVAQAAQGGNSALISAVLAIVPGLLESSKQAILDAVVKAIAGQA